MTSRLNFIKNSGLAVVSVLALPSLAFSMNKKEIGLQLYTLRDELSKNVKAGSGSIDFKPVFKEAKLGGMKYFFVEQENNFAVNSFESIKTSCDFISKNLI